MNLNNITFQPKQYHKKPHKIKEHLSQLASTIKIRMDENQILMDVINVICIDIKKSKQQLKKFSMNQNKENAKLELNKNITHLTKANKNLLIQKKLLFHKYIKLKNKYFSELEPINTEIKLLNDRKFILENIIKRREFEIVRNENFLEFFDIPIAREENREIYNNNIDMDEDNFINNLEKYQETLLNKLRDFNKCHNKTEELKKEKQNLKNIIKKIKEKKNINDFSKEEKNILFNSKKSKILQNIEKNNNSLLKSLDENNNSILSDIMNDTITSEYEDDENIEFISLPNNYKPLILTQNFKNKIPKINLGQIEFNKMKFKQEDAEKSLSRELKNFDEFKTKKKLIKSMIKKEKAKNKKLVNKFKNLIQKINMMKKIVNSMELYNYKLSVSAVRNIKVPENVEQQFTALSGRNKEIMELKLNNENDFENNIKKISKEKKQIIINNND